MTLQLLRLEEMIIELTSSSCMNKSDILDKMKNTDINEKRGQL